MTQAPSRHSSVLRRCALIAGVASVGLVSLSLLAGEPACTVAGCDFSFIVLNGLPPAPGDTNQHAAVPPTAGLIDASTWQSSPFTGPWVPFPAQRAYEFWPLSPAGDRLLTGLPSQVDVYLSPDEIPNDTSFAPGAGNIAEIGHLTDDGRVQVHNDTCANYFIRVVIHAQAVASPGLTLPSSALGSGFSDAGGASLDGAEVDGTGVVRDSSSVLGI